MRGRVVGSFLSLLTAIAFYSISVWVSGDALVGAMIRLFGVSDSDLLRGVIYALLGAMVIVVVVYGYAFMLLVNKIVVVGNTVLIALGVVAYAGAVRPRVRPRPGRLRAGQLLADVRALGPDRDGQPDLASAPSSATGRATSPSAPSRARCCWPPSPPRSATLVPFLFGVVTATLVAGEGDYVVALIAVSPLWYAVLLMVVAFLGGMSTGITSLYGTGLDFSSVFPRFSRVQASLFIGASRSCSSWSAGSPST